MLITHPSNYCTSYCEQIHKGTYKPKKYHSFKDKITTPVEEVKKPEASAKKKKKDSDSKTSWPPLPTLPPEYKVSATFQDPSTVNSRLIEFGKHRSMAPPSFHERIKEIKNACE